MIANFTNRLPLQRLSFKKKIKNNLQWGKECVNALSSIAHMTFYNINLEASDKDKSDYERMLSNYRLYNNELDQKDFQRECDPLGLTPEEFRDIVKPYNKSYNKISTLLGEEWKRPFSYMAVLVNAEGSDQYSREKDKMYQDYLYGMLSVEMEKIRLKEMQANPAPDTEGMPPEQVEQQMQEYQAQIQQKVDKILSPQQIEEYMNTKWRPAVEIAMDKVLRVLEKKDKLKKKKNDGFKHANISGKELVWVGEVNGEPKVEVLNPLKTFFHKSPEVEYVQDSLYAGYVTTMHIADIFERYGDEMSEEDRKRLETMYTNLDSAKPDLIGTTYDPQGLNMAFEWRYQAANRVISEGSYGKGTAEDIPVMHCEWKSQRKVGFLSYMNEDGQITMKMVDEEFKVPSNAKTTSTTDLHGRRKTKYVFGYNDTEATLEWKWIPEVWEGTRIAGDIYVNIRPKKIQFRSKENPFRVKLGYHGIVYNAMNAPIVSTMDRMKPFQFLYFITVHKMKEILAADKAPLINIDISMIPQKLTKEQFMHYMNMGINFYDPNQVTEGGVKNNGGGQKVTYETPRSTLQHVVNYINILNALDEQIGEVAGVTRQREGQTNPQESVTGTQTAIVGSNNVTELMFLAHNLLWEEILSSAVEVAAKTWVQEGKEIPYILDDNTRGVIKLNNDEYRNCEFGVFITDSAKDNEILQQLRALSQPMMQNGAKVSDIISIMQATSTEALKKEMKRIEDIRDKMAQAQEQAQQEHEKAMQEKELENREDTQRHEWDLQERKYEHEKELKWMDIDAKQAEVEPAETPEGVDPVEVGKLQHQIDIDNKTLQLEKDRLNLEARNKQEEFSIKREEVKVKKIAARKPKPASKK